MGTRNLICAVVGGEMKVAQYCQWDGYIEGQGKDIAEFITSHMNLRKLRSALRQCKFITEKQVEKLWTKAGAVNGMASMDVSAKFQKAHPELHRDTGAKIFRLIQDGIIPIRTEAPDYTFEEHTFKPVRELSEALDFAKDGLFCEYAYVLDTDKKVLEVYTGDGELKGHLSKFMSCYAKVPFADCTPKFMDKLAKQYQKEREND